MRVYAAASRENGPKSLQKFVKIFYTFTRGIPDAATEALPAFRKCRMSH